MIRAWRVAIGLAGVAIVADCWDRLGTTSRWWVTPCVLALAVGLPWCAEQLAGRTPPGTVPLTVVAVAAVSYLCVPETDHILPAAMPAGLVALVELAGRRPSPVWAQGAVALLVLWAGFYGATGRPSALVGAAFAWWPVLAGALIAAALPAGATAGARVPVVVAIGVVAAGVVARTGALADSIRPALAAAAVAAAVSVLATVATLAVTRPGDRLVARP
jgi:hypothetical protein